MVFFRSPGEVNGTVPDGKWQGQGKHSQNCTLQNLSPIGIGTLMLLEILQYHTILHRKEKSVCKCIKVIKRLT